MISRWVVVFTGLFLLAVQAQDDPLEAWRDGVSVRPVFGPAAPFHSIHTYFNTSPESPDGRWVLFFRSTTPEAHEGDLFIADLELGEVRPLVYGLEVEDGHRVACQQWVLGGGAVLFQDLRDGEWVVATVSIHSREERILATGRQVGFATPNGMWAPIYGPHWEPGEYRDLEFVHLITGEIRKVLSIDTVKPAYAKSPFAEYFEEQFGDRETSIFFPMMGPDEEQVLFKLSSPSVGGFRSPKGSKRRGLFVYNFEAGEYTAIHGNWGHPAWQADGKGIINMWKEGPVLIDPKTGEIAAKSAMPDWLRSGGHPSLSPSAAMFATDGVLTDPEKEKKWWGVAVGAFDGSEWVEVHEFDNSKGETSWRGSHPHPVFSPDGRRLYFNVSNERWTRLYVAEPMRRR